MGLFDKFKEKMEDGLLNASEKMEKTVALRYANNFIGAYNSSNFDYMKTCVKELEESAASNMYYPSHFFADCAKGIFIIASGVKNPPISTDDFLLLIIMSSNIKRFNNTFVGDDTEKNYKNGFMKNLIN